MLQQTRVEAVKGYYQRFLQAVPTIADLANAPDELLHKLWEGLGYYSRVRNLKRAAQTIIQQYNGVFPDDYRSALALPGIGEYTAGAICSIAFSMPTPAVDGNVLRVASRLTNDVTPIDDPQFKKQVRERLAEIYPEEAGAFTQALMELGATICGPNKKPDCCVCPCRGFCQAFRKGTAEKLPVKTPKKERRVEDRTVLILSCDGYYALEKRIVGWAMAISECVRLPGNGRCDRRCRGYGRTSTGYHQSGGTQAYLHPHPMEREGDLYQGGCCGRRFHLDARR